MDKNIFEDYIFNENHSGGLSLVKFSNEQQKGGATKISYENRFQDLVVPAGLVSCSQQRLRSFDENKLKTKTIGGDLFEKLFENIRHNKRKNITKNNREPRNKTKKLKK